MPGYGFSGKPTTAGWDPQRIARACPVSCLTSRWASKRTSTSPMRARLPNGDANHAGWGYLYEASRIEVQTEGIRRE